MLYVRDFVLIIFTFRLVGRCVASRSFPSLSLKPQRPLIEQLTAPLEHAEGPHWDGDRQVLYFVDISGQRIYQYDPYTEKLTFAHIGNSVGVAIPIADTADKFIIGEGTNLALLTWNGQNTTSPMVRTITAVDLNKPGNRFNDGKADATGRLWIGTMGLESPVGTVAPNRGTLFRMSNNSCKLEPVITGVSISNGLGWSLDNRFMYYIDSPTRRVEKFNYDILTAAISNRRTLVDFEKAKITGVPDGMTVDNNDNLWIACWGGSQIINVDSNTGKLLYAIRMPVERVTSVIFGGKYHDTLFVTSMRTGLTNAQLRRQPAAGAVFAISNLPTIGHYGNLVADCTRNSNT